MNVGSAAASAWQGNPAVLQSKVSTEVLKMSMDVVEQSGAAMIQMMEQSVMPNLGQNIDIRV